ncbi:MAG: hypothetical protein CM1200mP16_13390 [Nitrospina sp.]|nr:MAG: hypothetical protein CM1200mP16_13390 [Nitrospina sp.]
MKVAFNSELLRILSYKCGSYLTGFWNDRPVGCLIRVNISDFISCYFMLNGIGIFNKNIFTVFYANDIIVGSTPVYVEICIFFGKGFPFFTFVKAITVSFKPRFCDTVKSNNSL